MRKDNTIKILLDKIKKDYFYLTVVDINTQLIKDYKEQYGAIKHVDFFAADIVDLSFIEKKYDYVILPYIISAANERPFKGIKALTEIISILKPDGYLFIKEKMSTLNNNREEYRFYNWYRSRIFALEALKNNSAPSKIHFFLEDLVFTLDHIYYIDKKNNQIQYFDECEQKNINQEDSISKDKKEKLFNDLMQYKDFLNHYEEIFSMLKLEYENLKNIPSLFPPKIVLQCKKKIENL